MHQQTNIKQIPINYSRCLTKRFNLNKIVKQKIHVFTIKHTRCTHMLTTIFTQKKNKTLQILSNFPNYNFFTKLFSRRILQTCLLICPIFLRRTCYFRIHYWASGYNRIYCVTWLEPNLQDANSTLRSMQTLWTNIKWQAWKSENPANQLTH